MLKAAEATSASKGANKGNTRQSKASAWPTPGEAKAWGKGKSGDAAELQKQVDELRAQLREAGKGTSDKASDDVDMAEEGEADDVAVQGYIDIVSALEKAGAPTGEVKVYMGDGDDVG